MLVVPFAAGTALAQDATATEIDGAGTDAAATALEDGGQGGRSDRTGHGR